MGYNAFCPDTCGLEPCYIDPDLTLNLSPISLGAVSVDVNLTTFEFFNQQHIGSGYPATDWPDYSVSLTQSILIQFGTSLLTVGECALFFSTLEGGIGTRAVFNLPARYEIMRPLFAFPFDILTARADLSGLVPRPCVDALRKRVAFLARDTTADAAIGVYLLVFDYENNIMLSETRVNNSLPGFTSLDLFAQADQLSTIKLRADGVFFYHRSATLAYVRGTTTFFGLNFSYCDSTGANLKSEKLGIRSVGANNIFASAFPSTLEKNTFHPHYLPGILLFLFKRNGLFPSVVAGGANLEFLCSPYATDEVGNPIPQTNNAFISPTQTIYDAASAVVFPYGNGAQYLAAQFEGGFGSRGHDYCLGKNRDARINGTFSGINSQSINFVLSETGVMSFPEYENFNIAAFYTNTGFSIGIRAPLDARIDPSTRRQILFTEGAPTNYAQNAMSFGNTLGFARTYQYIEPTGDENVQRLTISSILWVLSDTSRRDVLDVRNMLAVI